MTLIYPSLLLGLSSVLLTLPESGGFSFSSLQQCRRGLSVLRGSKDDDGGNKWAMPFFASVTAPPKEGKASITTRLPLGSLFDSRDYIFSTATNVRGYEWTVKEAEELLDDLLDASQGLLAGDQFSKQDYELSQIVIVPMEWDTQKYGLGSRFDVHDGQQRLVTLSLLLAAMRDSFAKDENMGDTVTELHQMLNPPKTRKADILRIELHKRDNEILSRVLKNELSELGEKVDYKTVSRANRSIHQNYKCFSGRFSEMATDDRVKLLDYIVENVYMLVCIPESASIARNIVMAQGKGMDNEPIDDFKGFVSFRYTTDEDNMYETFDKWDDLAAPLDLDNGSVGRETVSDACLLRATVFLKNKVRKRDELLCLERWLRSDIIENKYEGHIFFKERVEPASLALANYRQGNLNLFGFYPTSKKCKNWISIAMRLRFLRSLTSNIAATRELEFVILELLMMAGGQEGKHLALEQLDKQLHEVELIALWMALRKPSVSKRYRKCFKFLDLVSDEGADICVISQEEKSTLREAMVISEFGATANGKKLALAILSRMNSYVNVKNGKDFDLNDSTEQFLELIVPVKGTKKSWGESWPDQEEKEKWMYRLGNLAIISNKATAKESKMSFSDKKKRYKKEEWPLTLGLSELKEWNSDELIKQLANTVNLIDLVWGL